MGQPSEKTANGASGAGPTLRSGAIRIAACYLGFAILWLGISVGVSAWVRDSQRAVQIATIEYTAFVLGTGALLFFLIRRFTRERAAVEEQLRRNERRYRSLVLATAQVTWRGEPSGEITESQPTWEEFTGQTFEQTKGWGWMNAIHPDDREHLGERWRRAIKRESHPPNDRFYEIEYRVRRRDGAYRNFLARTVPVLNATG